MDFCTPSVIYVIFSLTQILIDTFKGLYNMAFMKMVIMIMITLLLNILCESGLQIIAWFIVFIPFIFMTVVATLLLYIFGLSASSGKVIYSYNNQTSILPVPVPVAAKTINTNSASTNTQTASITPPLWYSSSSEYQSGPL